MPTPKEKYASFQKENYIPLFYRDWYLNAVCDGEWDVAISEEDDEILASWCYMFKERLGVKYLIHPELCPYMGPLFHGYIDKEKAFVALKNQLPKNHLIIQDFLHSLPQLTEFENAHLTNKVTYTINASTPLVNLASSKSLRRNIKQAEEKLTISEIREFKTFYKFLDYSFESQNRHNPYTKSVFENLDRVLFENNSRTIFQCVDENRKVVAMEYLMHDEQWVYNFANANDKSYRHNGVTLLLWHSIQMAMNNGKSFDFEGSMIPGVEAFFKSFGGTKQTYQSLYWSSNRFIDLLVRIKNRNVIPS